MLKIVVIDDCKTELERINVLLEKYLKSHALTYQIDSYRSPVSFMEGLSFPDADNKYDIYLLDVMMPGLDGIELGKRIRMNDERAKIIYVSASSDFALKSYEVRAFYYILKPLEPEKLSEVLDLAIRELETDAQNTIYIQTKKGRSRVDRGEIIYAELKERRSFYYLIRGSLQSTYLKTSFITANAELLSDPRFFACGASLIVNLSRILGADRDGRLRLCMGDGSESVIHIPLRTVSELLSAWMTYNLEIKQ